MQAINSPNDVLRYERLFHHWTQQYVADAVGTTKINVSRWERGVTRPGPYFRLKLCTLFSKSEQELGIVPGANYSAHSDLDTTIDHLAVSAQRKGNALVIQCPPLEKFLLALSRSFPERKTDLTKSDKMLPPCVYIVLANDT